jgi:hypothetical protein
MKGEERGDMPNVSGDEQARERSPHPPACADCVEARHEIMMAVFHETSAVTESVKMHMAQCPSCRAWEEELRRMHSLCGCAGGGADPARLTETAIDSAPASETHAVLPAEAPEKRRDRGMLGVLVLVVVLAGAILAFFLEGSARVVYPAIAFVVMLTATLWVHDDAKRRHLRSGFWAALQPFTVPVGFILYLICRQRATLRCPGCGAIAPARDHFCTECGRQLQEVCCNCGKAVRREFHVCPWCGVPLTDCFPGEEGAGSSCGWSRGQIAFVIAANAALFSVLLSAVLAGGSPASTYVAVLYCLGLFPIFNWTVLDSRRRAMRTIAWGILTLITGYIGFIIYLACRRELVIECPVCGSYPPASFSFCPCCGSLLNPACPRCGAAIPSGNFCAACGAPIR